MKISKKGTNVVAESLKPLLKKSRVVDAVVIHSPNLALNLKLQNLINFFLECLNEVLSPAGCSDTTIQNIERCLTYINQIFKENESDFDGELKRTIYEFFDEAGQFRNLINVFNIEHKSIENPSDVLIAAKSSRLQWLCVCILEELKHPFNTTI